MEHLDPTADLGNENADFEQLEAMMGASEMEEGVSGDIQEEEAMVMADCCEPGEMEAVKEGAGSADPKALPKCWWVSGSYEGASAYWTLTLRIDIDGYRPLKKVSGDFFRRVERGKFYFGSFVVDCPCVSKTKSFYIITGIGKFTWMTYAQRVRIVVPICRKPSKPHPAYVYFYTQCGAPGARFLCYYDSWFFRTVMYEQDYVEGNVPFEKYDTGDLPGGNPRRIMSVWRAYAEAGIGLLKTRGWGKVPIDLAESDGRWNNDELHYAMEKHFSSWRNVPQWKVWLLVAKQHEYGPGLLGIMFDQKDRQRQGCAVFHAGLGGKTPEKLRDQLYTYVHELGHCFNLLHSFQKDYLDPTMLNRPWALSWMNYPWLYKFIRPPQAAAQQFWNNFNFQFDDAELAHMRHGFLNNVIMGGNPFILGAAFQDPGEFAGLTDEYSGLGLILRGRTGYDLGEPPVVEIRMESFDKHGVDVIQQLHPKLGFVKLAIQKPNGEFKIFEPMMVPCIIPETVTLHSDDKPLYASAYIGYGKDGFYFDQVGTYKLRAAYQSLDGSLVLSNVMNIRVRSPKDDVSEDIADMFLQDQMGQLLALHGSRSDFLKDGNDKLEKVMDKYKSNRMAVYAKYIKGMSANREFKWFTDDPKIEVAKPDYETSFTLLPQVVDQSEKDEGVDNITLSHMMLRLAKAQMDYGDKDAAKATVKRMNDIFKKKGLRKDVLELIKAEGEAVLKEEEK